DGTVPGAPAPPFLAPVAAGRSFSPAGRPQSSLGTVWDTGVAGSSAGQSLQAAGGADGPGAPPADPGPRRSPPRRPWTPRKCPPGPAGTTQPQDDAPLRLLREEAGQDQFPQRPGLQRAEEILRG
ncbi:natriuretic peptides B preproprotein, partial [Daubentonia madagascariensis]